MKCKMHKAPKRKAPQRGQRTKTNKENRKNAYKA